MKYYPLKIPVLFTILESKLITITRTLLCNINNMFLLSLYSGTLPLHNSSTFLFSEHTAALPTIKVRNITGIISGFRILKPSFKMLSYSQSKDEKNCMEMGEE